MKRRTEAVVGAIDVTPYHPYQSAMMKSRRAWFGISSAVVTFGCADPPAKGTSDQVSCGPGTEEIEGSCVPVEMDGDGESPADSDPGGMGGRGAQNDDPDADPEEEPPVDEPIKDVDPTPPRWFTVLTSSGVLYAIDYQKAVENFSSTPEEPLILGIAGQVSEDDPPTAEWSPNGHSIAYCEGSFCGYRMMEGEEPSGFFPIVLDYSYCLNPMRWSPDGWSLAYSCYDIISAHAQGDELPIVYSHASEDFGNYPGFSPTRNLLAFKDGTDLKVADIAFGAPVSTQVWAESVGNLSLWMPDGETLAYYEAPNARFVTAAGVLAQTVPWNLVVYRSPDGTKGVLATAGNVQILTIPDQEVVADLEAVGTFTRVSWSPDSRYLYLNTTAQTAPVLIDTEAIEPALVDIKTSFMAQPLWSHDATWLAGVNTTDQQVIVLKPGSPETVIELQGAVEDVDYAFSPVAPALAVATDPGSPASLSVHNLGADPPTRYTFNSGGVGRGIVWQPDGNGLAFMVDGTIDSVWYARANGTQISSPVKVADTGLSFGEIRFQPPLE